MTPVKVMGAGFAAGMLESGISPATTAEQTASEMGLTRREAMLAVQEAIRQGSRREGRDYSGYLTDDIDLFYSRTIDTKPEYLAHLRQNVSDSTPISHA